VKHSRAYGEEDKDITLWLSSVDLKDRRDSSMKIVGFRLRGVMNVDRIPTARNYKGQSMSKL
jgi:hypothetical protein